MDNLGFWRLVGMLVVALHVYGS